MVTERTARGDILREAAELTEGIKQQEYAAPIDNLTKTADAINAIFDTDFSAADVALIMVLVKVARTQAGDVKRDTYLDAAAYVAIAYECAQHEAEHQTQIEEEKQESLGFPVAERVAYLDRLKQERQAKELSEVMSEEHEKQAKALLDDIHSKMPGTGLDRRKAQAPLANGELGPQYYLNKMWCDDRRAPSAWAEREHKISMAVYEKHGDQELYSRTHSGIRLDLDPENKAAEWRKHQTNERCGVDQGIQARRAWLGGSVGIGAERRHDDPAAVVEREERRVTPPEVLLPDQGPRYHAGPGRWWTSHRREDLWAWLDKWGDGPEAGSPASDIWKELDALKAERDPQEAVAAD